MGRLPAFLHILGGAFLICVTATGGSAHALTLSGRQHGFFEQDEYLVTDDILVPRGKTLEFAGGSIIRFKPFCGMIVRGRLRCAGGPASPVVFTSENDRRGSSRPPAPFDWNGIRITAPSSAVSLEHTELWYSVFGLEIVPPSLEALVLKSCIFRQNGRSDLSITGEKVTIETQPFSFIRSAPDRPSDDSAVPVPGEERSGAVHGRAGGAGETLRLPPAAEAPLYKRQPVRYALGILMGAGAACGIYYELEAREAYEKHGNASNPEDSRRYLERAEELWRLEIAGIIVTLFGVSGLICSFSF